MHPFLIGSQRIFIRRRTLLMVKS